TRLLRGRLRADIARAGVSDLVPRDDAGRSARVLLPAQAGVAGRLRSGRHRSSHLYSLHPADLDASLPRLAQSLRARAPCISRAGRPSYFRNLGYISGRMNPMLVLSRKIGERLVIAENIVVTVVHLKRGRVRLGIE